MRALGQWVPPYELPTDTGPAPGSGYEFDWRQELGEVVDWLSTEAQEKLGYQAPEPEPEPAFFELPAPRQAIAGGGLILGLLVLGGLAVASTRSPRRRR